MNADQPGPDTDNTAGRGRRDPASGPMGIRQAFREIRKGIVVMWWGFFDWVAVVSWKALALVSFLALIIGGGIFKLPTFAFLLIVWVNSRVTARDEQRLESQPEDLP